jgi:hypothetical protein
MMHPGIRQTLFSQGHLIMNNNMVFWKRIGRITLFIVSDFRHMSESFQNHFR